MPKKILTLGLSLLLVLQIGCAKDSPEPTAQAPVPTPTATPEPDLTPANAEILYCRSLLDETMTDDYDLILNCVMNHEEKVNGLKSDSETLSKIVSYVYADNPQVFWFTGSGISSTYIAFADGSFTPEYSMSQQEAKEAQAVIDARCSALLGSIDPMAEDYDKAVAVFRYVVLNTEYDSTLETNSISHVFIDGKGICGCYSKATQYLLNLMGIECVTVSGTSVSGDGYANHAWNLLKLDGEWYWLDSTWGDPIYQSTEAVGRIEYEYFCVTTEMISADHMVDDSFPVPECTATACNYYVHNGLLFDNYSFDTVQSAFYSASNAGDDEARIKFTNQEAYNAALYDLFDNQRVFEIYYEIWGASQCTSYRDPEHLTMSFVLP